MSDQTTIKTHCCDCGKICCAEEGTFGGDGQWRCWMHHLGCLMTPRDSEVLQRLKAINDRSIATNLSATCAASPTKVPSGTL